MKVLLIFPPYDSIAVRGSFPLGIGYLTGVLKRHNFQVKVLDLNPMVKCRSHQQMITDILESAKDVDAIGIGGMITAYDKIRGFTRIIKEAYPEKIIIVGGSVISAWPERFFSNFTVDVGVIGEGEETLLEVLKAFENHTNLSSINGIIFNDGEKVVLTPVRTPVSNLDDLPFTAWEFFDIEKYIKTSMVVQGMKRSMNIITSRGCPFHCSFCYRNFGRQVRFRSIESVINEIKFLVKHYAIHHIEIQDELFLYDEKRVRIFCESLLKNRIRITWRGLGRASTLASFSLETLKLQKKSGNHWIGIGIESGSPAMLAKMRKDITPEQVVKVSQLCRLARIRLSGTFIIGFPGETEETVRKSVELCKKAGLYYNPFYVAPYPGTELFAKIKQGLSEQEIDEMILKMSRDVTTLQVNCTNMSNEELIRIKEKAVTEVQNSLVPNGILDEILFIFESQGILCGLKRIFQYRLAIINKISRSILLVIRTIVVALGINPSVIKDWICRKRLKLIRKPLFSQLNSTIGVCVGSRPTLIDKSLLENEVKLVGNSLPSHAHIEVSGRCQLRCWGCSDELKASNRSKMAIPDFRHILDSLPSLKSATLTIMNEPLLNDELPRLVFEAKARGIKVDFPTNGVHFPDHLQYELLHSGLDSISFSIDSMDPYIFNLIRSPANLENVLENLRAFIKKREKLRSFCVISITAVLNDNLLRNIDFFIDKSFGLGLDKVVFRFPHSWKPGDEIQTKFLTLAKPDVLFLLERVKNIYGEKISYYVRKDSYSKIRCLRPFRTTGIKVDGQVVPCCLQASDPKQAILGNIYLENFLSIWDGMSYQKFRQPFLEGRWPDICEGCTVLNGLNP